MTSTVPAEDGTAKVKQVEATSIYEPVQEGLVEVEANLKTMAKLRFPFLSQILTHVFETKGKRVRPALTLLASGFVGHDRRITEIMATAVELLHIATLIHDDTVDDSDVRHGKATISSLWGRNVAVLAGDYIFAASATYVCDTGNIRVVRRFSETIMELSSGELEELAGAYHSTQTRQAYFDRVFKKTASLFTVAGESGAILSGASESQVQALRAYSTNLGMAFQIIDDILDFQGTMEEAGKPVGADLSHGIMTLPAILAVEQHPGDESISSLFAYPGDPMRLERAVAMIQDSSIMDDSYSVAEHYGALALEALTDLPRTPSRSSLEELVEYVLTRRK